MIFFALQLLELPFIKLMGAALLLWIGTKLMVPEDEDPHDKPGAIFNWQSLFA